MFSQTVSVKRITRVGPPRFRGPASMPPNVTDRSASKKQMRRDRARDFDSNGPRRMAMVCKSAPHHGKRGRNGVQIEQRHGIDRGESMDRGHVESVFTVCLNEKNAGSVTEFSPCWGAYAIGAATRFQHGGCHCARIDLPAGMCPLALGHARCHDVDMPFSGSAAGMDRHFAMRPRPSIGCAAAGRQIP